MNEDATLRLVRALCFARVVATHTQPHVRASDGRVVLDPITPPLGHARLDCGHTVSCLDLTGSWEDPPLSLRVVCPACLNLTGER